MKLHLRPREQRVDIRQRRKDFGAALWALHIIFRDAQQAVAMQPTDPELHGLLERGLAQVTTLRRTTTGHPYRNDWPVEFTKAFVDIERVSAVLERCEAATPIEAIQALDNVSKGALLRLDRFASTALSGRLELSGL